MKLFRRNNDPLQNVKIRLRNEPYLVINLFFAVIIILIILYFVIFSPGNNNYPVVCLREKLTGEPCISCGLSHSFSLIVRGRIEEAYRWNEYGMRVFLFFASQLLMRVTFSIFYIKYPATRKQLILTDSVGSGLIFLITFWPYFAQIVSDIL